MRELPTFTLFIMAHMKWIYAMIVDNDYPAFKKITETAVETGVKEFKYNGQKIDTVYAQYVCKYVDNHAMPAYDKHLTSEQ